MASEAPFATAVVRRGDLFAAVKWAAAGVDRHPALPVLAAMPVTLDEGQVTFGSYATGVGRAITRDGDGTGQGMVLADGTALVKALTGLPGKGVMYVTVTIRPGGVLELAAAGITVCPPATGPDHEYPQLPLFPGPVGAPSDPAAFTALASAAARCAEQPGTYRPVAYTAVRIAAAAGQVTVTGGDRYHMYHAATGWDGPDLGPLLLPAAALAAFTTAADGSPIMIRCEQDAGQNVVPIRHVSPPVATRWQTGPWAELRDATHMVTARGIDPQAKGGEYPDVTPALRPAAGNATIIAAPAATLARAATRVIKIGGRRALIRIAAAGGDLTVHAVGGGNEDQSAEQLAATVTGPDAVIHFEAQHLADVTDGAAGDVRIGITGDQPPAREGTPPVPSPVMVYGGTWSALIQVQHNARHKAGHPAATRRPSRLAAIRPAQGE